MLIRIPAVLQSEELARCRADLERAAWQDGRGSAGYLSQAVKRNCQLPDTDPTAVRLGEIVLRALERNALFTTGALPAKVLPPLFNRYADGQSYGDHIDGAIRPVGDGAHRVRTDLSATLFLSAPEDYDGGELVVQDHLGEQRVKLPAGDLLLYPGASAHRVEPVTRGTRLASFFWVQSMVRDDGRRGILFELDGAIQALAKELSPQHGALVRLAGVYHNLLRGWADV